MKYNISSRRYLGNKFKLLPFIRETVENECSNINTFFDVFSGTGSVASAFTDKCLIVNDLMYSNYLAALTWFSPEKYDERKLEEYVGRYNSLRLLDDNYMSINFGNTYFSVNDCKKIGFIREDIEAEYNSGNINGKERAILITSMIYSMDKIANTCGHYDSYIQGITYEDRFFLNLPDLDYDVNPNNQCYNMDSNELAKKVTCDIAYLDPPYNSRQYCDAYHLLENVAEWKKPQVYGVAKKMDRSQMKSEYCKVTAANALEDLVENLNCRYILMSYNNNGSKFQIRSNAKISDQQILEILSKRGEVKIFKKDHRAFSAGKSENNQNQERLFLCKVNKKKRI
ncbi:TPA: DNA adenine methylase [Clostridioides difficile]|nr:DNA adenine methylase [Clostridioides difficile]HCQ6315744.1 DNA adenine methylase [Clostridioides difficile]